jgi:hypothetical protein
VTGTHLRNLLRALEDKHPPPRGCHHAITVARHGSDGPWKESLALHVFVGEGLNLTLYLEDADFDKTPADFADEVLAHVRSVRR